MPGNFAKRLVQARLAAGFKSGYAFYHNNGGRRHFPFTYVHYLRIERGVSLPRPQWLGKVLTALRLSPGEAGCRRLFLSFMEDQLETREAFELVLGPLLCRHPGDAALGAGLPPALKAEHAVHLTPEQFKTVAADEASYWCSEILANDGGAWSPETLARKTGLSEKAIRQALDRLAAAGLARKSGSGSYKSRRPGKYHTFPGRLEGLRGDLAKIEKYWDAMSRRAGAEVAARVEVARAEPGFIRRYASTLTETVEAAAAGSVHSAGDDTALYLVEAKIRKLMPL